MTCGSVSAKRGLRSIDGVGSLHYGDHEDHGPRPSAARAVENVLSRNPSSEEVPTKGRYGTILGFPYAARDNSGKAELG